jgi:hypothetical protein
VGGHPYWYFVPYQESLPTALAALREREFRSGRYNPVISFIRFDEPAFSAQAPGARHRNIDDAVAAAGESGTRSILDIRAVGKVVGEGIAAPLPTRRLREIFGTERPTREMLVENPEHFEDIDRGQCIYVVVYQGEVPTEIYFAGYSYD